MSPTDSDNIDNLLSSLEAAVDAVQEPGPTPAPSHNPQFVAVETVKTGVATQVDGLVEAMNTAAATVEDIAVDVSGAFEAPPPRHVAAHHGDDGPLAGDFAPPSSPRKGTSDHEFHRLLAIEVPLIVQLAGRRLTVAEVMRLGIGSIIEFVKPSEDELDLLVNNKTIGKGHAVKVGENFGLKVTSVGSVEETIRKLGGRA